MTLYEYLEQTTDWEVTVWDKDYDIETYFYKTNGKDKWDKAMNDLAKLLTISRFSKDGLIVNLAEIIEKKLPLLEKADLFIKCKISPIMDCIDSVLAGNVSESWLEKFVEVLSKKVVEFNGRKYTFRPCDVDNISEEELQKKANECGKIQYEPNGNKWLVVKDVGYGWEI